MKQPNITVYGSLTCPDTARSIRYLDTHQVAYEFRDVDESPQYNDYIAGLNHGKRVMPTIQINNADLFEPTDAALADAIRKAEAQTA